jgi:hypothetical protein
MKSRLTLVILSIMLPTFVLADSYFVDEPTVVGVSKDDAVASSELIRSALQENHKSHLVARDEAQYILKPKLVRFGTSYVMTLEKTQNGNIKYSSQLKTQNLDDLDTVARRLTHSVVDEVPVT